MAVPVILPAIPAEYGAELDVKVPVTVRFLIVPSAIFPNSAFPVVLEFTLKFETV